MIFLKLGGSLITDKTRAETARPDVITRLGEEIRRALADGSPKQLLIGNGSGSFGHVAAARHGTRAGVHSSAQWFGFAEVSDAAIRINALVRAGLRAAGVPAMSVTASASARCVDGLLVEMAVEPIRRLLSHELIPLLHGDVAIDDTRGGTIVSTEQILAYLAPFLEPRWLLLAGETNGVYDQSGEVIPVISPENLEQIRPALGGSRGTDVTGGMASKVEEMLALARHTGARIRIFDGRVPDLLYGLLRHGGEFATGTLIQAN